MTEKLSEASIQRYQREGYIVPDTRLPASTMAGLQAAVGETIDANPKIRPEHLVSAHIDRKNDEGVRGLEHGAHDLRAREVGPGHAERGEQPCDVRADGAVPR